MRTPRRRVPSRTSPVARGSSAVRSPASVAAGRSWWMGGVGEELVDGWVRAGAGFKQQQACSAGGKQELRPAGSTEMPAGDAVDGSDRKLETGAEVETRGAVGAEDGEACLTAKIQVAEQECPGGVAGRRGNGLRPQASSQVGGWVQSAQGEGELAFACCGLGSAVESTVGTENNGESNRQQKGNGDCQQQQAFRSSQSTGEVRGFHCGRELPLRLRL